MGKISDTIAAFEDWQAERKYPSLTDAEAFEAHLEAEWDRRRAEAARRYLKDMEDDADYGGALDIVDHLLHAEYGDPEVDAWFDDPDAELEVTKAAGGQPLTIDEDAIWEALESDDE